MSPRLGRWHHAGRVLRHVRRGIHNAAGTNPEEVHFAVIAMIAGTASLIAGKPPRSFGALFPHWAALLYCLGLIIAAIAILFGVLDRHPRAELAGLILMGSTACAYGVAVLAVNGWDGVVSGAFLLGYGTSQLRRARMILEATQRLHEIEAAAHVRSEDLQ